MGRSLLHATTDLARRIERTEIDFCALAARPNAAVLDAGGGRAVYSGKASPLTKVLGLGIGGTAGDDDLSRIEAFYFERQSDVRLELCPLAGADLAQRLSRRGYRVVDFENQLARPMPPTDAFDPPTGVSVEIANGDASTTWADVVSEAIGAPGVMRCFVQPEITRYLARVEGSPAGGGAMWVGHRVAGIFGTATLPAFRRRGVQHAVVARCLQDATARSDLAIATVEPGSLSQRTFERFGFQVVYTRTIFVRNREPATP